MLAWTTLMSSPDSRHADQTRTYNRASSVVFLKTDAPFGGLSNMAGGYPLRVNGIRILTSEALYQACRFPHRPEVQTLIIGQKSPMTAKMKSKPYRHDSRPDWDQVRVKIMRWCLRVKLAQNWRVFSELLLATGERPIVEESRKDDFWGAKATDDGTLVGMNVLGRLLMELREAVKADGRELLMRVQPLAIPDFLLGGRQIEAVGSQADERDVESGTAAVAHPGGEPKGPAVNQPSLFDTPVVMEAPPAAYFAVSPKGVYIADLKPYAEYKESGLPWLGQVPKHWETRPAFGAFVPNHDRNHGMKEKTVLSLSYGRIVIKPAEKLRGLVPESFETYQIVNPGDIVLRTTDLQNDHTSLRVGMVRDRGIITSAYLALRTSDGVSPEFGFQFLNVWDSSKAIYGYGSGLRQNLDFSHFKRMPVSFPPPSEQAAIVRLLDWANGRLEQAIRAKRKVIALLNEQKQAIIHRAVTRGLDPSGPLKPSGIPWLGDIPLHWEVRKLRTLFRLQGSGTTPSGEQFYGGSTNWVMSGDLNDSVVCYTKRCVQELALETYSTLKLYPPGSLVVAMYGATIGKTGILGESACTNQACCVLAQPVTNARVRFVQLAVQSAKPHLVSEAYGGGQPNINAEVVRSLRIGLPPVDEQERILESVDDSTGQLDTAISRLEREIDLLREYRTRLVADVVTGKLDVREAAARLPGETPIDTAEDDADLDVETEAADEEAQV